MPNFTFLGSAKYQEEKGKEVYSKKAPATTSTEKDNKLLQVWSSVKVLLTNPTFMFLNLAAAAEGLFACFKGHSKVLCP